MKARGRTDRGDIERVKGRIPSRFVNREEEAESPVNQAEQDTWSNEGYWYSEGPPRRIGESNKSVYTDKPMGDATARLKAVAADFGLPVDVAKNVLTAAAAELTARENTARATAAPRLKWPDDAKQDETPAHFAARAYEAEANAGTLHRGVIGREDRARKTKLASDLSNWLRTHPWPEDVPYIPTKPEWNDRQIEAGKAKPVPAPRTPEQRLYDVQKARRLRGLRI